jgi:hypothetical protein
VRPLFLGRWRSLSDRRMQLHQDRGVGGEGKIDEAAKSKIKLTVIAEVLWHYESQPQWLYHL